MTNEEFVKSLRELADYYEAHPTLRPPYAMNDADLTIYAEGKADIANCARNFAGCHKEVDASFFRLHKNEKIGEFSLHALEYREKVCQRVVVGSETVEQRVPETYRTETVTRDIVEWHCPKLLGEDAEESEAAHGA